MASKDARRIAEKPNYEKCPSRLDLTTKGHTHASKAEKERVRSPIRKRGSKEVMRVAPEVLVVVAATIGAKLGPHFMVMTFRAFEYVSESRSVAFVA